MEKTHNLEVTGSSPVWSTRKISNLQKCNVADFSFCEKRCEIKGLFVWLPILKKASTIAIHVFGIAGVEAKRQPNQRELLLFRHCPKRFSRLNRMLFYASPTILSILAFALFHKK